MPKLEKRQLIAVPWYERDDFEILKHMTREGTLPARYEEWQALMARAKQIASIQGIVLFPISIRMNDYFEWLAAECRPDTEDARSCYIQMLASKFGAALVPAETTERPLNQTSH